MLLPNPAYILFSKVISVLRNEQTRVVLSVTLTGGIVPVNVTESTMQVRTLFKSR